MQSGYSTALADRAAITLGSIDRSMRFLKTLTETEKQTASSRFWTRFADSISYDNNLYIKRASPWNVHVNEIIPLWRNEHFEIYLQRKKVYGELLETQPGHLDEKSLKMSNVIFYDLKVLQSVNYRQ